MQAEIFELVKEVLFRVTSGRFIFTVVAAVLLFHGSLQGKFQPDQVMSLIKDVVIFYFVVKHALSNKEEK